MTKNKNRHGMVYVATHYAKGKDFFLYILLAFLSLLSAACNVILPLLEKIILEKIDPTEANNLLWAYFALALGGIILLILVNFANIRIMYRLRHALEKEMIHSLTLKSPEVIKEKGAGAFASAITGDSEQVATMIAGNWFAIIFNFIGAIISVVISATWYMPFMIISLVSYLLIILVIIIFNKIQVIYFKKGKEETYYLSPRTLEIVEKNEEIQSYSEIMDFENYQEDHFKKRDHYQEISSQAEMISKHIIQGVQIMAVATLFFFAVNDIIKGNLTLPTLIALVAYFETIFVPVSNISLSYTNISKFKAFYSRMKDFIEVKTEGVFPHSLKLEFKDVSLLKNNHAKIEGFNLFIDGNIALVGLNGEEEHLLIHVFKGHEVSEKGNILFGDKEISNIYKHLRLPLLRLFPELKDSYDQDLQFNITMGKPMLNDKDYNIKLIAYKQSIRKFLIDAKEGKAFEKENIQNTIPCLHDLLAVEKKDTKDIQFQKEIMDSLSEVDDIDLFVEEISTSLFSRKYVRKSRYDSLVTLLNLKPLENMRFGIKGSNLSTPNKVLVQIARFLLPDNDNPYVLLHPLMHLPPLIRKNALEVLKQYLVGREGLIISNDTHNVEVLASKIAVFKDGKMIATGTHQELLESCPHYLEIIRHYDKHHH